MGYCPRCGENTNLGSGPDFAAERRLPLRVPVDSNIVDLASRVEGDIVRYAGTRFKVTRERDQIILWAIE